MIEIGVARSDSARNVILRRADAGSRASFAMYSAPAGKLRHSAAIDGRAIQSSMELTADRRSFIYFPRRHHFEQNCHVRHRLQRYGAERCMQYQTATPEVIADGDHRQGRTRVDDRPVETDGARNAGAQVAELL